MVAKIPKA